MQRLVRIDGKDFKCDVTGEGGELRVSVGGARFSVRISKSGDGFSVSVDGASVNLALKQKEAADAAAGTPVSIPFDGREIVIECPKPTGAAPARPVSQSSDEPGTVAAMMPGTIIKVIKAAGDKAAKGEVLLVLEAMKMENEVRSPLSGTVSDVLVAAGKAVQKGEVLMRIKAGGQ